ncbi:MAG: hypothetical protein IKE01_06015 [Clostridia bacterium]|nr:hypothetical protein [Clostridia bacterium]
MLETFVVKGADVAALARTLDKTVNQFMNECTEEGVIVKTVFPPQITSYTGYRGGHFFVLLQQLELNYPD